jgi:hypothetical protein
LVFVFDKRTSIPIVVAKFSRDEESARRTEVEHKSLLEIRTRLSVPLAKTVPEPLALDWIGNRRVAWESILPGYPCPVAISKSSFMAKEPYDQVCQWLIDFQGVCTYGHQILDDDSLQTAIQHVGLVLAQFNPDERTQQQVVRSAQMLRGLTVSLVFRHGDLHPTNLLFLKNQLSGVIDWEMADKGVWPFFDWFQFVFQYEKELAHSRMRDRDEEIVLQDTVKGLFAKGTSHYDRLNASLSHFLTYHNIPAESVPFLWLLYAAEMYLSEGNQNLPRILVPAIVRWANWGM